MVTSFCSSSLPVFKETKVDDISYSPRYQPLTELYGEPVSTSSMAVVRVIKILNFTNISQVAVGEVYILLLQHAFAQGELGYLVSLASAGRYQQPIRYLKP